MNWMLMSSNKAYGYLNELSRKSFSVLHIESSKQYCTKLHDYYKELVHNGFLTEYDVLESQCGCHETFYSYLHQPSFMKLHNRRIPKLI